MNREQIRAWLHHKAATEAVKRLAAEGKLVEGGFRAFCIVNQVSEVMKPRYRDCYYAAAQHLFASIIGTLDPESEPTDADLQRMDLIHRELDQWVAEQELKNMKPGGSA